MLLLLAAAAIALAVTFTSRSTTNPIRELSRATREIAAGNFDVRVSIKKDRVEEFGELQRNFNTMAAQLKSNEYLRKDFISNVSHELKTPLSIMNGYAQLLAEGGLTEGEEREYARLIADEAQRLTELTGNMLRLSRIDHRGNPAPGGNLSLRRAAPPGHRAAGTPLERRRAGDGRGHPGRGLHR